MAARRPLGLFVALLGLSATVVFVFGAPGDYPQDAAPAVSALAGGHLLAALRTEALMGSFSIVLRAPFVALTDALGLGGTAAYQAGAFACFVPAAALAVWLSSAVAADRRAARAGRTLVAVLVVANPATAAAVANGHPEEVLAAALAVAAVALALRGRTVAAAVTLGLALATKQWAVVAVVPAVLAAPRPSRMRLVGVAAAVAGALTLPLLAADATSFAHVSKNAASTGSTVTSSSVWFLLARPVVLHLHHLPAGLPSEFTLFKVPAWVGRVSHPLIVVAALPFAALLARRRNASASDALALLALAFLFRSALDPVDNEYYHAPLVLALLAWEALAVRRRLPVVSLLVAVALWLTFDRVAPVARPAVTDGLYLAWVIPLALCLAGVVGGLGRPRLGRREARIPLPAAPT